MPALPLLVARILLSVLFIVAGFGKIPNAEGMAAYMQSGGVPGFLIWPVIALEVLGGLAILVGFFTRPAALALGAFCVVSGAMFHFDPADQMQMTSFMKNLGLAGGFLLLWVTGPGAWSVDAMLGRKSATV
ncbi:DoxX family protein [Pararhodobacter zhoushanensis]|uniref:DoxX family protein n=1 Tax=Pararhodobacter zhoushanensis TaxID=2479545 RepID=A0ABT3GZ25_9RHOB|nr:DoxX family protein [Pararhodobacter zhoushanensis]MCW1932791.1 DoxX family protein [Pararhodobacter zhoushanensis]